MAKVYIVITLYGGLWTMGLLLFLAMRCRRQQIENKMKEKRAKKHNSVDATVVVTPWLTDGVVQLGVSGSDAARGGRRDAN